MDDICICRPESFPFFFWFCCCVIQFSFGETPRWLSSRRMFEIKADILLLVLLHCLFGTASWGECGPIAGPINLLAFWWALASFFPGSPFFSLFFFFNISLHGVRCFIWNSSARPSHKSRRVVAGPWWEKTQKFTNETRKRVRQKNSPPPGRSQITKKGNDWRSETVSFGRL